MRDEELVELAERLGVRVKPLWRGHDDKLIQVWAWGRKWNSPSVLKRTWEATGFIIDHLTGLGFDVEMSSEKRPTHERFGCLFEKDGVSGAGHADSLPEAVARAALAALTGREGQA